MIKKKYKLIIRFNIIGCIFLVLTIFSFVLMHHLKTQGFENATSLAENYEDETIKVGEALYVDIVERPVKICRYSDDVMYYEINDGDRFYIMRAGKDWYDDMMDGIAEDGEFHVVGSVLKISDSDKETLIEHFNDKLPDNVEPWTKESFDDYYKGVHSVFVTVVTRDGRKHKIAMMNALFKGVNEAVDTILSEIHKRNPNAVIGEEQ